MRQAKRYQTNEQVSIQIVGKLSYFSARIENLSETGAALQMMSGSFLFTKRTLLKLTLNLGSIGKSYEIFAKVVWIKNTLVGVKFINKSEVPYEE